MSSERRGGGRPPKGPDLVEALDGPELAKERARVVLETIAGRLTIEEACEQLGVGPSRFHAIRREALEGMLEALAPKPRGRPSNEVDPKDARIAALEEALRESRLELRAEQVRTELALTMPQVIERSAIQRQKKRQAGAPEGVVSGALSAGLRASARCRVHELRRRLVRASARSPRRGVAGQRARRVAERAARKTVVAFARWARRAGVSLRAAARRLGLSMRTLLAWFQGWRRDRLSWAPRGRPVARSDRATRQAVLAQIRQLGPDTGVDVLRARFPKVARAELRHLLGRYRRALLRRASTVLRRLTWAGAGKVWAADYTQAPAPIEGRYRYVLVARDLATGQQLTARALVCADQDATLETLEALFRRHGRPLVLKTDGGGHFTGDRVRAFLGAQRVLHLVSPPKTPTYNGAIEAGIGSLRHKADYLAARAGRPARWTIDDLEAARRMANETARPRGPDAPTPQEAWQAREPIDPDQRQAVWRSAEALRVDARLSLGYAAHGPLNRSERDAVDRQRIRRALEQHGILRYQGRRVTPRFRFRKYAGIT